MANLFPVEGQDAFAGLTAMADAPPGKAKMAKPCEGTCPGCGLTVVTGTISVASTGARIGERTAVETHQGHLPVWVLIYDNGAPEPRLVESQAYPEHRCPAKKVLP
jgi:hypothetical protein